MNEPQIVDQLTQIFHNVFDDEKIVLRRDLSAKDVDGWDSLIHLRLMMTVERTFKVKFSAAETNKLANVGQLIDLVAAKSSASR